MKANFKIVDKKLFGYPLIIYNNNLKNLKKLKLDGFEITNSFQGITFSVDNSLMRMVKLYRLGSKSDNKITFLSKMIELSKSYTPKDDLTTWGTTWYSGTWKDNYDPWYYEENVEDKIHEKRPSKTYKDIERSKYNSVKNKYKFRK